MAKKIINKKAQSDEHITMGHGLLVVFALMALLGSLVLYQAQTIASEEEALAVAGQSQQLTSKKIQADNSCTRAVNQAYIVDMRIVRQQRVDAITEATQFRTNALAEANDGLKQSLANAKTNAQRNTARTVHERAFDKANTTFQNSIDDANEALQNFLETAHENHKDAIVACGGTV